MTETKITPKNQTTIPSDIRAVLGVNPGDGVEWYTLKSMVIVDAKKRIKDPIKFLTSKIKSDIDAVELVRESREDFQ